MEPICSLCSDLLDNSRPETTLLCNHSFHTRCILLAKMSTYNNGENCPRCNARVYTEEMREIANVQRIENEETYKTKIYTECSSNPVFMTDFKALKKVVAASNKHLRTYTTCAVRMRREFRTEIAALIGLVKQIRLHYVAKLRSSSEYRGLKIEKRKIRQAIQRFERKHTHYSLLAISRVRQLKGTSIKSPWRYRTSSWDVLRYFRFGMR